MQTQCPHCETRFRVTESQINAADGYVRCSICEEVFNAFEVAEQDELQASLLSQDETQKSSQAPQAEQPEDEIPAKQSTASRPDDEPCLSEPNDNTLQSTGIDSDTRQAEKPAYQNKTEANLEASEKSQNASFNKTSATDDSGKEAFDFFDDEDNEPLSHVVPEQFKQSRASSSDSFLANLLWGIGTLLLIGTLAIEYVWFNRDRLNQIPQLQIWTEKLCQQIECKDIAMRNPAKIELISRNVYSHPNEKNALMISVTMKNMADFAQPYPVMQIRFSDVRGNDIAARRFLPDEYLPAEILQQASAQSQLFEPDTNMTFTLEIQDPGKQAMTYEFDFL